MKHETHNMKHENTQHDTRIRIYTFMPGYIILNPTPRTSSQNAKLSTHTQLATLNTQHPTHFTVDAQTSFLQVLGSATALVFTYVVLVFTLVSSCSLRPSRINCSRCTRPPVFTYIFRMHIQVLSSLRTSSYLYTASPRLCTTPTFASLVLWITSSNNFRSIAAVLTRA